MSQLITVAQLKAIAGGGRSDLIAAIVNGWPTAVIKAKLTTRLRAAHFLAQVMTETGGLTILSESGAYRYETILKIFGAKVYSKQFGGKGHSAGVLPAEAKRLAAMPVAQRGPALFNRVYGTGNPAKMKEFNNTGPNDGWLYRGGGMMQCTGKNNYAAMAKKTGLPLVAHPEMLHQPDSAFMAAYLEWAQDGRCNAAADRDDVAGVRKIINGGANGLEVCKTFLAKAKKALAAYDSTSAPATLLAEPEVEPDTDPATAAADDDVAADAAQDAEDNVPVVAEPAAIDPDVEGDPELFSVQKRLKARHYSPGIPSGKWGGMTASAIAGFANDEHLEIGQLRSVDQFREVQESIKSALAVMEADGRFRPVTEERAQGDAKTVATVAPEVVPAKRGLWATISAAVVSFFTAMWDTISSWFSWAWDLFSDHKDDIPSDTGLTSTVMDHVRAVPLQVWGILAFIVFGLLAWNAHNSVKKITAAVKSGERQ